MQLQNGSLQYIFGAYPHPLHVIEGLESVAPGIGFARTEKIPSEYIFGVQGVRKSIIFVPLSCRRQPIWCPLSITLIFFCVPFTVAHRTHWLSWNLNIPCVTFFRQILYRGVTECLPFLSYLTILAELLCMVVISKYAFKMCNKKSFSYPTTAAQYIFFVSHNLRPQYPVKIFVPEVLLC